MKYDRKNHFKKVCDTMCMTQNMGVIFFENGGVWHKMYDTKIATKKKAFHHLIMTQEEGEYFVIWRWANSFGHENTSCFVQEIKMILKIHCL